MSVISFRHLHLLTKVLAQLDVIASMKHITVAWIRLRQYVIGTLPSYASLYCLPGHSQ